MMQCGWDIKKGAACAVRIDDTNDLLGGVLSVGISTEAEKDSPGKEAACVAAATVVHEVKEHLNQVFDQQQWRDSRLVVAAMRNALANADIKLQNYGQAVAQGVYAGGCICLCYAGEYIIVTFGGATVYKWNGDHLKKNNGGVALDGLIRTALGTGNTRYAFLQGKLAITERLIITSEPFTDEEKSLQLCKEIIEKEEPFAPTNATAILIRQVLETNCSRTAAVLDIQN